MYNCARGILQDTQVTLKYNTNNSGQDLETCKLLHREAGIQIKSTEWTGKVKMDQSKLSQSDLKHWVSMLWVDFRESIQDLS